VDEHAQDFLELVNDNGVERLLIHFAPVVRGAPPLYQCRGAP